MKLLIEVEDTQALNVAGDVEKMNGVSGIYMKYDTRNKGFLKK